MALAKTDLFCLPQHLESYGAEIFNRLARARYLAGRERQAFVAGLAELLGDVNALHPFREGNGRAQRAFVGQLARDAGYALHWEGAGTFTRSSRPAGRCRRTARSRTTAAASRSTTRRRTSSTSPATSTGSTEKNVRPVSPRGLPAPFSGDLSVIWMRGSYPGYLDYHTSITTILATGGNRPPIADATITPATGPGPLTATLDGHSPTTTATVARTAAHYGGRGGHSTDNVPFAPRDGCASMSKFHRLLLLFLLMMLGVAAAATPSRAAPLSGVLATDVADGPIAAYLNTAAWSRWDEGAGGYRLIVDRGGTIRALDVAPSSRPFELSAGRGPDGATWLVWARCGGGATIECDIEGFDLGTGLPKSFAFAARPGVLERAPAIDGDRLVYVVGGAGDVGRVHLSALDGTGDRVIDVLPPSTCALSLYQECFAVTRASALSSALRGDRVAVTSRVSTSGRDFGVCGLATVRLLDLRTSAVRTLDSAICGLGGQGLGDVTFDADGRLWWRQSCADDPSACQGTGGGPFRQTDTGLQRLVSDVASRLAGVAVAGRTPIIAARAPRTTAGCWTGPGMTVYRCGTVTAIATPSYADIRPPRETLPPPGYVTVTGTSHLLVLRPPATLACSRGDIQPKPGATLWAGVSRVDGQRRRSGPAVRFTATSGGRQGYLHKLEAGRVNDPSPRVLQRLSEALELPYRRLMALADYLLPAENSVHIPRPQERTAMTTDTAPTNRELVRLLERVLEQLAEINRGQHQLAEALERITPRDA